MIRFCLISYIYFSSIFLSECCNNERRKFSRFNFRSTSIANVFSAFRSPRLIERILISMPSFKTEKIRKRSQPAFSHKKHNNENTYRESTIYFFDALFQKEKSERRKQVD